jgi:AcrR family transcriptional regulator
MTAVASSPAGAVPHAWEAPPSRRDDIVAAAAVLFAERSYRSTSVRDIADAAGLKAGSIYNHFAHKDEILVVLGERFYRCLARPLRLALEAAARGEHQLPALLETAAQIAVDQRTELLVLVGAWRSIRATPALAPLRARQDEIDGLWRAVLSAGVAAGAYELRVDVDAAVWHVDAVLRGIGADAAVDGPTADEVAVLLVGALLGRRGSL